MPPSVLTYASVRAYLCLRPCLEAYLSDATRNMLFIKLNEKI